MKGLTLTLLALTSSISLAQSSMDADASLQLFQRIDAQDTIKLEHDADARLVEDHHDVCALLVKARILTRRGRLAEALRQSRLAVESARANPRPNKESEPRWETLSLYELSESLRLVDKTEEQLFVLRDYLTKGGTDDEKRNKIVYPGGRRQAEALLKLGRLAESRSVIDAALASTGLSSNARVGWLYTKAILSSFESAESGEAVDLLTQIVDAGGRGDQGLFYVRGQLHQGRKDFTLARADHLASFNAKSDASSAAFPGRQLALLDLHAGSWRESVEWSGRAWGSLLGKSPVVRQDLEKDMRCTAAQVSVLMGYPDLALQILENHSDEAPRFGGSLQNKSQWECWAGVSRWLARRAAADFNPKPVFPWSMSTWRLASTQLSSAVACSRISEDVLHQLSAIGDAPLPPVDALSCTSGDPVLFLTLIRMLGPSVARGMLTQWPLRNCSTGLDALIDAEIAWRSGDQAKAKGRALEAINEIAQQEPVLRARAMVILGMTSQSQDWIAKAWAIHPAGLLLAGERIPVKAAFSDVIADQLSGLIVIDQNSPITLTVDLESSSPSVELFVFQKSGGRMALNTEDPVLAIKRMLLCPLRDGLSHSSVAALSGQSRTKSNDRIPGANLLRSAP
jgi:hypothetical protein